MATTGTRLTITEITPNQDKMMTVKRYHDEFMSVFKNLVDIQNRTVENIGRNMRQ